MLDNTLRDTPQRSKRDPKSLDAFTRAYIECALWSSTIETEDGDSEPMDDSHDITDLAPACLESMVSDCIDFQAANAELLAEFKISIERAGHDFWLTRNHHGAGFWGEWSDGGRQAELGRLLTDAAHAYGSSDLYVGDDGMLYCA